MAKIMLVEDDNNLREIYEARLLAEGYQIVSARDGEEALALAVKEKPDLIISDVMMPKISGFDMLDILRTTPETKNTKVIMMTALSQAEDQARAGKLGADRYLIKSQVTLEDVARVAREVLEGEPDSTAMPSPGSPQPVPVTTAPIEPAPEAIPVANEVKTEPQPAAPPVAASLDFTPASDAASVASPAPTTLPMPTPTTEQPVLPAAGVDPVLTQTTQAEEAVVDSQISTFAEQLPVTPPPQVPADPAQNSDNPSAPSTTTTPLSDTPAVNPPVVDPPTPTPAPAQPLEGDGTVAGKRVLQPPSSSDPSATPDLQELLKQEEAKEANSAHGNTAPSGDASASSANDPNSIAL